MTVSERSIRPRKSCLRDSTKPKTPSQEYALKKVFFDEIEVREYPQILGDNPAVTEGMFVETLNRADSMNGIQ